ncbi:hypothetical protein KHA80_05550 [Anaerobacillus sp. HL2]|nr:hypothetical protein KHA80_05550 [Anaerobacillus sp. HL2]
MIEIPNSFVPYAETNGTLTGKIVYNNKNLELSMFVYKYLELLGGYGMG